MARLIGVMAAEYVAAGLVEGNRVVGERRVFPDRHSDYDTLGGMPAEEIASGIAEQVAALAAGGEVAAVGVGFPGVIRGGVVEDSPNLQQAKGHRLAEALAGLLAARGLATSVHVLNDTDALAAGLAATRDRLDRLTRVWYLGSGVGFGRYPQAEGVWEGGHTVVSLDPKETFCSCGGAGHLEGVMGYRSMRLRFLDLEPEEVFEHAAAGDERCREFMKLWHRALAAATATSVHLDGPGQFFIAGPNARHVEPAALDLYLQEMVKMSPLQGSAFEVVATGDETAIVGAAVSAAHAAGV